MKKLDIIYEDKELLVVNKPCKLLTISNQKSDNTLYSMAKEYVKKQHKSNKIFIVHRLDKDTSGVVVFAKKEEVKKILQSKWNEIAKREYIAVLEGVIFQDSGVIQEYLKEDKTYRVYATSSKKGEYAKTNYKVKKRTNQYTVVQIQIETGKKHQIRVGFSNLGYPIVGDKKYKGCSFKRMMLHASKITLQYKDKEYTFECKVPKEFLLFAKF